MEIDGAWPEEGFGVGDFFVGVGEGEIAGDGTEAMFSPKICVEGLVCGSVLLAVCFLFLKNKGKVIINMMVIIAKIIGKRFLLVVI
jgi:hypothetical protein